MSTLPTTVSRYRVERELGRGMMGVVYLAHDPDLGRDIALKVIQLPGGATDDDRAGFEGRFFSEARSAARLSHPGIVIVHDVGRDATSGAPFMALQFVPGQTLDRLLKEKKRLEMTVALRIAKRLAEALHHAHSQGVVHRDIKPSNIMILPNGEPMIMDFGIAKLESSKLTATGQFVGTPLYMSPEQALARPVDGRSDIFSLGSVIYEMLTGQAPFGGESVTKILFQLISSEPEPASVLISGLPPAIDVVLRRCLAKDPGQRYADGQALANDIAAILDGTADGLRPIFPHRQSASETAASGTAIAAAAPVGWKPKVPEQSHHRRSALAVTGLLFLGVVVWSIVRLMSSSPVARRVTADSEKAASSPAPAEISPEASVDPSRPAELVIDFEHSLKSGVLRVFVDDFMVVDEPFDGRVTRKIAGLEMRKGHITETLEVSPGPRTIRVEVRWEDNTKTERTQAVFKPGGKARLRARLGSLGGLRKDLSLEWS